MWQNIIQHGPAALGIGWGTYQLLNYRNWIRRYQNLRRDIPRVSPYVRAALALAARALAPAARIVRQLPFRLAPRALWGHVPWWIRGAIQDRANNLQLMRIVRPELLPQLAHAPAGIAAGALSASYMLTQAAINRRVAESRQSYHFTTPDASELMEFPDDYGPVGQPQSRSWGLIKSRRPIRESKSGGLEYLPPLNKLHYGRGMYTEVGSGFSTRMPPEMTVDLVTRFTHSHFGMNDLGGYRTMTVFIKLNQIYNLFSNLGAFSPGTYSQDAEFWFSFYDKVHVEAFDISYHIEPYKVNAGNTVAYFTAYLGNGFETADDELGLASIQDVSDWSSQHYGQGPFVFSLNANAVSSEKSFDFSWQIDCINDFGPDVASDNRIDQKSDGTMVIAADPKYYKVHVACFNDDDTWTGSFSGEVYLKQRCRFYDRKSLVHA